MFHIPVLLQAFLEGFRSLAIHSFVDGTIGSGQHAAALLSHHPEIEVFYGIDRDPDALELASDLLRPFQAKVILIHGDHRDLDRLIPSGGVDGIFLDLGVSSMQLDRPEKGFSVYHEGPLDMRMDPSQHLDAADVVNTFSEKELGKIFRDYGEEPRWKKAAHAIIEARKKKPLKTTQELKEALKHVLTWGGRRGKKIHPMTLVFQAIRICVNDELGGLEKALPKAVARLRPGGRLGIIAFHSLEDRIVKHYFRQAVKEQPSLSLVTKKPVVPSREEMRKNPRSRSAKFRILEKRLHEIGNSH